MPTDKPYTISVRIKQHDKPTRRVPPAGTAVGQSALAVIALEDQDGLQAVEVLASTQEEKDVRDTTKGIALWLALGTHLAERTTSPFEQFFFSTVLHVAFSIMKDPGAALALQEIAGAVLSNFEKVQEEAAVEQAKRTSTEGKN